MAVMWHGRTQQIQRPPIAAINGLAAELRAAGRELIDLGQAIAGLPPPASALRAVERYLAEPAPHGYSPDPGLPEVREQVAAFLRSRKGIIDATADRVVLTCGANQAFANALWALTQPGDEVILFGPHYFDHRFSIVLGSCVPVEVGLSSAGGRFAIDEPALERALSDRTRCVVLVSPANPAGMVFHRDQVAWLSDLCHRHGLWLISDETYDLLTFAPAEHRSPAALGRHDQVVVVGSFSKTFALAGWRIGYLHGPLRFVDEAIKVQDALVVCAPVPAQRAIAAALADADDYLDGVLAELTRRREALLDALAPVTQLTAVEPDGATFAMVAIAERRSSIELATSILRQTGVVTVPGVAFGPHGEGYLRLSFGNQPPERIRNAVGRIGRLLGS